MSDRGSFVTDYIYCDKCMEAVENVFDRLADDLWHTSRLIGADGEQLPIVAGKLRGLGGGDDLFNLEYEIAGDIAKLVCHKVRIAALPDGREARIIIVTPGRWRGVTITTLD